MTFCRSRGADCTEAVAREMLRIGSFFGRLARIAAQRDPCTGQYRDEELGLAFGNDETQRVLRKLHLDLFLDWLCYPLERQVADLKVYLSETAGVEWELVMLARAGRFERLIPDGALTPEGELFASDLEIALCLALGQTPDGKLRAGS